MEDDFFFVVFFVHELNAINIISDHVSLNNGEHAVVDPNHHLSGGVITFIFITFFYFERELNDFLDAL